MNISSVRINQKLAFGTEITPVAQEKMIENVRIKKDVQNIEKLLNDGRDNAQLDYSPPLDWVIKKDKKADGEWFVRDLNYAGPSCSEDIKAEKGKNLDAKQVWELLDTIKANNEQQEEAEKKVKQSQQQIENFQKQARQLFDKN